MIDFRDFMHQADSDLIRAERLYDEKDFGFAAYSAQQALEKYIKSYLLRLEIFKDPQTLGHLQYNQILSNISNELNARLDLEKPESHYYHILKSGAFIFSEYSNVMELLKDDKKKMIVWKESLKIPLTPEEQRIDSGLVTKLNSVMEISVKSLQDHLTPLILEITPESTALLDADAQKTLAEIIVRYVQIIQDPNKATSEDLTLLDKLVRILNPFFYGSGAHSITKNETDFFLRVYYLVKTLTWSGVTIESFPHEEIGRYPTCVNETNSIILYENKKEELKELINRITITCNEIKTILLDSMIR